MSDMKKLILDEINSRGLPSKDVKNSDIESCWELVMAGGKMWDVEFWTAEQMDGSVVYKITAYPMTDVDQGDYTTWITVHEETIVEATEDV